MSSNYERLAVKEEMWAKMLMEVLSDHHIPCLSQPVYGAGMSIRSGKMEELIVYVPRQNLPQAQQLLEELFSEDNIAE